MKNKYIVRFFHGRRPQTYEYLSSQHIIDYTFDTEQKARAFMIEDAVKMTAGNMSYEMIWIRPDLRCIKLPSGNKVYLRLITEEEYE